MRKLRVQHVPLAFLVLPAVMLGGSVVQAAVHKCTNAKGEVSYSDTPCPKDQKSQQLEIRDQRMGQPGEAERVASRLEDAARIMKREREAAAKAERAREEEKKASAAPPSSAPKPDDDYRRR